MRGNHRKGQQRQQNLAQQGQAYHQSQQNSGTTYSTQGYGQQWDEGDRGQHGFHQQGYGQQGDHPFAGSGQEGRGMYGAQTSPRSNTWPNSGPRGQDVWERNSGGYPESGNYFANEGDTSGYRNSQNQYDDRAEFEHGASSQRNNFDQGWHANGPTDGRGSGGISRHWNDPAGSGNQNFGGGWQGNRPRPNTQGWFGNQNSTSNQSPFGENDSYRDGGRSSRWSNESSQSGFDPRGGEYGNQGAGNRSQYGNAGQWDPSSRSSSGQRSRGTAPKGYKKSDQRLNEDLGEALMDEGIDCSNVEVQVKDGVVTITGEVADRSDKYRIEHVAAEMMGVTDVENQLRIAKRSSQTESKPARANETTAGSQSQQGSAKNAGDRSTGSRNL